MDSLSLVCGTGRWCRLAGAELWRIELDRPEPELPRLWAMLSAQERARATRLIQSDVQRRYVVSHAALRAILGHHLSTPPGSVTFLEGPHGKPAVADGPPFNLSHSGELALCAVAAGTEVGVDVEQLRPVPEADLIVQQWFAREEQAAYRAAADACRNAVFFDLWTRREAYLKALGTGLFGNEASPTIDPERWEVHRVQPGEGYTGALVVERPLISPPAPSPSEPSRLGEGREPPRTETPALAPGAGRLFNREGT